MAVMAAGLLLFSCNKPKVIELSVSPQTVNFGSDASDQTVTVSCNDSWTVSASKDWVKVSVSNGENNGSVKISVTANEEFSDRFADVTVKSGEKSVNVVVSQMGLNPSMGLSGSKIEAPVEGGTFEVTVTTNTEWTVATPSVDWVSVSPASGKGDGKIVVTVQPTNLYETRATEIAVESKQLPLPFAISVKQDALAYTAHQKDSLALVKLFDAFGGADKMKSDRAWDLSKPINEWYGVTLTEDGRVSVLKFLKGTVTEDWTLPAAIGELTELTDLRFVDCKVVGAIPEEIYSLTKLTTLYLTNNKVTGTLSAQIANLTELTNIYIDQNPDLGGSLPAEIGQLVKLVNLNISKTAFSGAIPESVTNLDALKNFMAYSTKLSEVPDFWDQLASLELVQLYDIPTLTGTLPASLGNCAKLKNIYMYDCNLEGNIPEAWGNLPSTMVNVRVQGNKLKGVVPAAVVAHPKWTNWKPDQYILPQQEGYGLTLE